MEMKAFEKVTKRIPDSVIDEMDAMSAEELHKRIAECEENMAKATQSRDKNDRYLEAKSIVGDFNAALREAKQYQNAKLQYALIRLRELNDEADDELTSLLVSLRSRIEARRVKPDMDKAEDEAVQ